VSDRANREAIDEIVGILDGMFARAGESLALHEPEIGVAEKALVMEALDEGYVSYAGRHVGLFEAALAQACGARHAVALASGTSALHLLLHTLGIGKGDEVLCPSLTFVASANAIVHAGAQPHFVDCTRSDLSIDCARLESHLARVATREGGALRNRQTGRRLAAVMPVHVFGRIGDMAALRRVAANWSLPIVEDATESLGSRDAENLGARVGVAAALSFNGNKIVTTGGGGAIVTDDSALAARLKHLSTTAKLPHRWAFFHDEIGFNYRMPNLNAALGLAQLGRLGDMLVRKRRLAARYRTAFAAARHWTFLDERAGCADNFWLNAVMLHSADTATLDAAFEALHAAGFVCRPCWTPMHRLAIYADAPRDELPVTGEMADRIVCLPSSPKLAEMLVG